ncbi:MAG: DNA polymerase III subunit beta [Bacilli bacterium]|jgi:DNA polymerase-3 subunit beta
MKFAISKNYLLNALNTVSRAVSSKNPRAILTGIKFELNHHGLFLTGSDSDISIVTKVPMQDNNNNVITSFEPGVVVVSSRFITDIIRKLEGSIINFETLEENTLKITDTISDFSLNCMESRDYPVLDLSLEGTTITLPTVVLNEIINQTSYAASDKETRPILTGVNFRGEGRQLECVATDSYRLAKKSVFLEKEVSFNITIPAKTLNEVAKVAEGENSVEIIITDKKVNFRFQNSLVSTRVINGAYPDTSKLIPLSFECHLDTIAQSFVARIERASLLSVDRNNVVRLSMNHDGVSISAKAQEVGSAVETVNDYRYEGERLDVSFAAKFVIDAIKALGCEAITMYFNSDSKPFIIKNEKDSSCIQLVLPVRTY